MSKIEIARFEDVKGRIIKLRKTDVILDSDVAELYGVETKRINEAVKNNPDKFPEGYLLDLSNEDWESLRSKFSTLNGIGRGEHRKFKPKAFTEKGLYMLATILKSERAIQTTIAIVDTFAKIRHLSRSIKELSNVQDKGEQKALMQKSGELITEILDDDLAVTDSETSIELNFAVLKFKHTVKKKKT